MDKQIDLNTPIFLGQIQTEANNFCFKSIFTDTSSSNVTDIQKQNFEKCRSNFFDLVFQFNKSGK